MYRAMDYWEDTFPEIARYVREDVRPSVIRDQVKRTVVKAEVKSGKRLVAQCFASYTNSNDTINVFMSAYVRKADSRQRDALAKFMLGGVFTINTKNNASECRKRLRDIRTTHPNAIIVVHFDEFDHGSGSEQLLNTSGLWGYIDACPMIRIIQYSASPEEALIGDHDNTRCIPMPAHRNYRGARYYLDAGLVCEAEPPLRFSDDGSNTIVGLGPQLLSILNDAREHVRSILNDARQHVRGSRRARNIVIVRVTDGFAELQRAHQNNAIPELVMDIENYDDVILKCGFVASTSSGTITVEWDNYVYWEREVADILRSKAVRVLFIDQMCTRSTDWFCHPFLYAYHDYHGPTAALNTIIQSNLRAAYYQGKKNDRGDTVYAMEDHPIRLYGSVPVFEFVAGVRRLDQLDRRVSSRARVHDGNFGIWGLPMRFELPTSILSDRRFTDTLRDDATRDWIKQTILAVDSITLAQKEIIQSRELQGKRNYKSHNTVGGINTVHSRHVQGRESSPGGGIPDERVFDERDKYFWLDIAQEDVGGIRAGTVFVTYGLPDGDREEDTHVHTLAVNRDGTSRSIFGLSAEV